jgi:phosphotransferase system enzyme I (PtsI)
MTDGSNPLTPTSAHPTAHPFEPHFSARGVSRGIAVGKAWFFQPNFHHHADVKSAGPEAETARFKAALNTVVRNIAKMIEKAKAEVGDHEAEIFEAHSMMVQDEELQNPIFELIQKENCATEVAIEKAFAVQIEVFSSADTEYLRERALDLKDLKTQLLDALDSTEKMGLSKLLHPVILVAEDLTPSQTITLDRKNVLGIITEKGGETSHTAIIARTLGIPAITGVTSAIRTLGEYDQVAMDGAEGSLFVISNTEMKKYFIDRAEGQFSAKKKLERFRGQPSQTSDGYQIKLFGNIGSAAESANVVKADGEGVGLFRTEFLFMERKQAPTLEEQRKAYAEALNSAAPREVVIRTLDVGGDKAIPFIHIEKEENPFLGVRALRYCLNDKPLFKTQIKAMLLANEQGNLSIMLPMVSRATEAKQARDLILECDSELKLSHKKEYKMAPYRIGAMVEIPSVVFEMQELAKTMSFISVGTNDLLQYTVAVDRMNPHTQNLYCPYNLGFIRLMKFVAKEAIRADLDTGICGELGGHEEFLPLWIAMGFQKLSMVPGEILSRRYQAAQYTKEQCDRLLEKVLYAEDETEVRFLLKEFLKRAASSERDR